MEKEEKIVEDEQKIEEQMVEDINENCIEDKEFVKVVGDTDEVINEKEEEVK